MVDCVLGLDDPETHLFGRPRVVLRDELRAPVAIEIRRTVANVEKSQLASANGHYDDCAAHALPFRVLLRRFEDSRVRLLASLLQAIDVRSLLPVFRKNAGDRFRSDGARSLAGSMPTHPVA